MTQPLNTHSYITTQTAFYSNTIQHNLKEWKSMGKAILEGLKQKCAACIFEALKLVLPYTTVLFEL